MRLPNPIIECPNCHTSHRCEIWRDDDGAYAEIDTRPCQDDDCHAQLCTSCPQFQCDGCGLVHCESHRVRFGSESFCRVCMKLAIDDAEVEIADQETAELLMMLSAAGCTIAEVAALQKAVS